VGKRIPLDQALETVRANKFGRMVGRGRDNRIEPECWPSVRPSFHFTKDQKFFAIGSCFAKNISKRLALDGYNVLGATGTEGERRNRYTPPAIFQEIAWAGEIYHRDDQVRDEDILPLLIELSPGKWADMWSLTERGGETTLKAAIARRRALYDYFRGAFEADVVIITLGLIEAWWDEVSQSYVVFDTPWARRADRERFQFEKLSFDKCRDYIEKTLKLLLDGKRRVLITTSPVVLARTFTDNDIIIANNHSKSVLRAVAGELSDQFDDVDYFPSYEIATMTRKPEVWEDDLIHIQPNFVARIMQHVTNAYVPGSVGADDRTLMKMANLVESMQFDAAEQIYAGAQDAIWESTNPAVHAGGMALARNRGRSELAVRHAAALDRDDPRLYTNHPEWMYAAAHLLQRHPQERERGERIAADVREACAERRELYQQIFVALDRTNNEDALRPFVDLIIAADIDDPMLVHKACAKLQSWGKLEAAREFCERQRRRTPDHPHILAREARILLALGLTEDAIAPLTTLTEVAPEDEWGHLTLTRTLMKLRRPAEALDAVDRLLSQASGHPYGLALKARLLWKASRKDEAVELARRALDLAPEDAQVAQNVQLVLRELAV